MLRIHISCVSDFADQNVNIINTANYIMIHIELLMYDAINMLNLCQITSCLCAPSLPSLGYLLYVLNTFLLLYYILNPFCI